jgi:molecular chaperone HtpG
MTKAVKKTDTDNTQPFGADVSRLLDIVTHALYTQQDVFLRELISNAADACDRLRYEALQNPALAGSASDFRLHIYKDTVARTLTIVDNGIGMNAAEMADHLGTIAKSGTAAVMKNLKNGGAENPLQLIGQFGVGFYASFMVADLVTVISRKAGSAETHAWISDGKNGFSTRPASAEEMAVLDGTRGTAVTLSLKDSASEFLLDEKIKQTAQHYSDHISIPIYIGAPADQAAHEAGPVNQASALWARPKTEVTPAQYLEFYKHISLGLDEPILTCHFKAEGKIEFSALLFVPTLRPWDLFDPSRKHTVRLYVRRVFITDDMQSLMYPWLRFVRGVIDSADLPLNISRESLQHNPMMATIRSSVTKRILGDLEKLAHDDAPAYETFWGQFGATLKEGLYDAVQHRTEILKLCRFFSSHDNGARLTSLADYTARMKPEQKEIYYISGENLNALKNSPQIEGFKSRGLEVLFFTDTIDDFWLQQVYDFESKTFKSVTKGDIDLSAFDAPETKKTDPSEGAAAHTKLTARIKTALGESVHDVRISKRLTDSPVCLIAPEGGIDMHMERVLKIHQSYTANTKPVLEINTTHPLIQKLEILPEGLDFNDAACLLLDQARIIQGEPVEDMTGFIRRLNAFMARAI